jgi:glycine/D-amino acid oxidase-like deaminating enzyme
MARFTAIVIGGGIGGLAAAAGLSRAGWRVTVFEQAPQFAPLGAGIAVARQRRASAGMARGRRRAPRAQHRRRSRRRPRSWSASVRGAAWRQPSRVTSTVTPSCSAAGPE